MKIHIIKDLMSFLFQLARLKTTTLQKEFILVARDFSRLLFPFSAKAF